MRNFLFLCTYLQKISSKFRTADCGRDELQVFLARGNVPAASYKFFMDILLNTIRYLLANYCVAVCLSVHIVFVLPHFLVLDTCRKNVERI